MSWMRRFVLHSPKVYIAALILNILVCFPVLLGKGFDRLIFYYDGMTAAGAVSILVGLLILVSYFGAFDIFGYSFSMVKYGWSDYSLRRDKDYVAYKERKSAERSKKEYIFMPFIITGTVFLTVGIAIWKLFG